MTTIMCGLLGYVYARFVPAPRMVVVAVLAVLTERVLRRDDRIEQVGERIEAALRGLDAGRHSSGGSRRRCPST